MLYISPMLLLMASACSFYDEVLVPAWIKLELTGIPNIARRILI